MELLDRPDARREVADSWAGIVMRHLLDCLYEIVLRRDWELAELQRARKQGRVGGPPRLVLDRDHMAPVQHEGKSLREISDQMGLSLTRQVPRLSRTRPAGQIPRVAHSNRAA
jgi:hypothetical protein